MKWLVIPLLFTSLAAQTHYRPAMVRVPVADLVGAPIKTFKIAHSVGESYVKIAYCGAAPTPRRGHPVFISSFFMKR